MVTLHFFSADTGFNSEQDLLCQKLRVSALHAAETHKGKETHHCYLNCLDLTFTLQTIEATCHESKQKLLGEVHRPAVFWDLSPDWHHAGQLQGAWQRHPHGDDMEKTMEKSTGAA